MGISPDRLEAQGFGDQHPIADNSTPEGRQKNRRIALLATQK
ncbi:MAG TPA: OmpA family protein [Bryobacteraceae bacterium]|nr:OmpA family protein [Bryobacteraceae bacterium]